MADTPKNVTMGLDINNLSSDRNWVRQAFFIPGDLYVSRKDAKRNLLLARNSEFKGRTFNSAELKYTDTTLGGNFVINPKPQFTRWADPKLPGLASSSMGMGEYYSEAIDDNKQMVHMQFGVPEYNSLTNFFTRFYDHEMGDMVNTGDAHAFSFQAGRAAGFLLTLPLQALFGISNVVNKIAKMAFGNPSSKFYYMKPTMPLYWSTVSTLVNKIAVNMGITEGPEPTNVGYEKTSTEDIKKDEKMNYSDGLNSSEIEIINNLLPNFMRGNGGIDIYAVANRAQRLANQHHRKMKEIGDAGGDFDSYSERVTAYLNSRINPPRYDEDYTLPTYMDEFYKRGPVGSKQPDEQVSPVSENTAIDAQAAAAAYGAKRIEVVKAWEDPDYLTAELQDGSAFVTFGVDYAGSASESFSNSTKKSDIASSINSASSTARSMDFNFASGNITDNFIGNAVEGVFGAISSFVKGGLASINLGGLAAAAGSAYADIPDFWDDSSADLPRSNYTIKLATPYGNKLSILMNIYVPLCMLLAGSLPRSTGKNSYSSPFLCSTFHQGRNIIRLGIIDSLSIERGTGGIGWSADGLPTAVDVSFSVINLNKIMHIPVTDIAGPLDLLSFSMLDEDTVATDYMAMLGGLRLYDQYYFTAKLRLAWRKQMADINTWMSPSRWSNMFVGSAPGRLMSTIYKGTSRF